MNLSKYFHNSMQVLDSYQTLIALISLSYIFFGKYLSGMFQHRGYDFKQIIEHMSYGTEGIYGIPIYVSCTFVFLFIKTDILFYCLYNFLCCII